MLKVILAHPGTQYSFQLAKQLHRKGILLQFHTGIAYGKDSWVFKVCSLLPASLYRKLSNRFVDGVPDHMIRRNVLNELRALVRLKRGRDQEKTLFARNGQFQRSIGEQILHNADVVIGFDTSSWILADTCKRIQKSFFLDVSIAHPLSKEKVYKSVSAKYPEFAHTVKTKPDNFIEREQSEIENCTHIIVASTFSYTSYVQNGLDPSKISIIPYGVDAFAFKPENLVASDTIRFVFVGLVDARKGIPLLLDAWKMAGLKQCKLTLIGPVSATMEKYISTRFPEVEIKGRLSFDEVKRCLPDYDVMVFPSFFEGFGLVIPEAMACGLPVITTTATCGPDVIVNGQEGYVIDPGDEDQLKEAIKLFIAEPSKARVMGKLARKKAEQLTWNAYGERWAQTLLRYTNKKDADISAGKEQAEQLFR